MASPNKVCAFSTPEARARVWNLLGLSVQISLRSGGGAFRLFPGINPGLFDFAHNWETEYELSYPPVAS